MLTKDCAPAVLLAAGGNANLVTVQDVGSRLLLLQNLLLYSAAIDLLLVLQSLPLTRGVHLGRTHRWSLNLVSWWQTEGNWDGNLLSIHHSPQLRVHHRCYAGVKSIIGLKGRGLRLALRGAVSERVVV